MIYEPREDSLLLVKWVNRYCRPGMLVLDMGCGSGIQGKKALEKSCGVTFVDVDQEVVNSLNKYNALKSDLFENIKDKFDLITFNPPYLPEEENESEDSKRICSGGKEGWELIDRFFSKVNSFLNENGSILIVFSSLTNKEKVDEIIIKAGFRFRELENKKLFFEVLYLYEVNYIS